MDVSVFQYSDPQAFLSDVWREKKSKNSSLSLRSWSRQLGLKSHNSLYETLKGKRPFSRRMTSLIIKNLKLNFKEGLFLETLTDMLRAQAMGEKELYLKRLQELSPKSKLKYHEVESFQFLKNPLHTILLELSELKNFNGTPSKIRNRLSFSTSIGEIEQALNNLKNLNLIREDPKKVYTKAHKHLFSKLDKTDLALREFHNQVMVLASRALATQNVSEREFNAYAINIKKSDLPKAKEKIRQFMSEFANELEAPSGQGDSTYELGIQFFNLTRSGKE